MLRLLVIFTLLSILISYSFNGNSSLFHLSRCFKTSFVQIVTFEGEKEIYSGILISKEAQKKLIYLTKPPFEIFFDGTYLKMGYKGEGFQTFKADEYPNPILGILLHLNDLIKVFKLETCSPNFCVLKPKSPLSDYLKRVKVFFRKGVIKKIVADGEDYGVVKIFILKWKDCSKSAKVSHSDDG